VSERQTWFVARHACSELSSDTIRKADLATIHSEEIRVILKERYLTDTKYWIGLVGLVWYWENGITILTAC